jgi:hypothetical protein
MFWSWTLLHEVSYSVSKLTLLFDVILQQSDSRYSDIKKLVISPEVKWMERLVYHRCDCILEFFSYLPFWLNFLDFYV